MTPEETTAALAGTIGVVGSLAGVTLSTWFNRKSEDRRLQEQDARRWLVDRREAYAKFLGLAESMLREIDRVAIFLSYEGDATLSAEDEALIEDGLADYLAKWEEELAPDLGALQLLAEAKVADLADRVSGALMEVTGEVERRGAFTRYYPTWWRCRDLVMVLRNSMRVELGLPEILETPFPRVTEWPWLPDRPNEAEYIRRQARIPGRPPLTQSELAQFRTDEDAQAGE